MKKVLVSLILVLLIVTTVFSFSACTKVLSKEDAYKALSTSIEYSTKLVTEKEQYYTHVLRYEDNLTTVADERFLNVIDDGKLRIHYYRVDSSDLKETKYFDQFYGTSLPTTSKKEKEPSQDKYKTYLFLENVVNGKPNDTFTKKEMSKEDFFNQSHINDLTALSIIGLVKDINADNSEVLAATKTGHVTEIIIKLNNNAETSTNEGLKKLYAAQNKADAIQIRMLDNKIDKVAVVKVKENKTNKRIVVDDNSNALVAYFLTYVGPNIKYFGSGSMPNYDQCADAK